MIAIRPEAPADVDAVHRLTEAAFAASELGHHGEAQLVDTLRAECPESLSLVAVKDDEVVGHILFTTATLTSPSGTPETGMGLAPMSVSPGLQKQGVGSRLIRDGLDRLRAQGTPFVIVLGHPDYYPKFGFERAVDHGVQSDFPDLAPEHFMIQWLDGRTSSPGGVARYHSAFYE